jgi:hypothetical protein
MVREMGISTALQKNAKQILREILNMQVILLSGITWGL